MNKSNVSSSEDVSAALSARCDAVVAGDVEYLETILLPEFRHIHATGREDSRADYINSIRSGNSRFTVVSPERVVVDAYSGAAVAAGDIYIERIVDGQKVGRSSRFVSVWRNHDLVWKLAFWQMTGKTVS